MTGTLKDGGDGDRGLPNVTKGGGIRAVRRPPPPTESTAILEIKCGECDATAVDVAGKLLVTIARREGVPGSGTCGPLEYLFEYLRSLGYRSADVKLADIETANGRIV